MKSKQMNPFPAAPKRTRTGRIFQKTDSFGQPELFLFGSGGRKRGFSQKKTIEKEEPEPDGFKKKLSEKGWTELKGFEQEGFRSAAGILLFDLTKPAALRRFTLPRTRTAAFCRHCDAREISAGTSSQRIFLPFQTEKSVHEKSTHETQKSAPAAAETPQRESAFCCFSEMV